MLVQNLMDEGLTMVPFGQGYKEMSPASKEFYKVMLEGKLIHGGDLVLRWMASNVVVDQDPAGNIKPTKAKSIEKIDGIVALIMALGRSMLQKMQAASMMNAACWFFSGNKFEGQDSSPGICFPGICVLMNTYSESVERFSSK